MKYIIAAAIGLSISGAANAQSSAPAQASAGSQSFWSGWSGEGNLGAGITTGNTDTVDISVGLKLAKEFGPWKVAANGGYDFGQVDGVDNRNRWYVGSDVKRDITDRLYGFGSVSYEEDEFSGFDSRLFIGTGAGYHISKDKPLLWSVEAAPGYRRSVIADETDGLIPPTVIAEGFTANDFAIQGSSQLAYHFNDNVNFTNDTTVTWTDTSTQTINIAALNAKLTEALSARVSFEVRNDTSPPDGFVNTDTATRVSVVYGF